MPSGLDRTRTSDPRSGAVLQAAIVLLVCLAVYWIGLGRSGLAYTEGHRAIPGWELLSRESSPRNLLVPTLFEQPYLRKPPLMPWAVALASSVLGPTEFAARSVSALAITFGSLVSWWFARRWFGPRWALHAGLAHALTPLFWQTGRAAEIEALHNLFIQLAVLGAIDLFVRRHDRLAPRLARVAGVVLVTLAAAWTKGPAGAPVLAAAALAIAAVTRPRALVPALLLFAIPAGVAAQLWAATLDLARRSGPPPLTQGVGEFLWSADRIGQVLALPLVSWASALPLSAALLFPFGPDARREADADDRRRHLALARALALTTLLALLAYAALGVSNPRYAMPAFAPAAPLVAWVLAGRDDFFVPSRRRIASIILLGRPAHLLALLLLAAGVYLPLYERSRARNSGREAGFSVGVLLPPGATLHADALIDARPEILWYARRANPALAIRWTPSWNPPPVDRVALLRTGGRDELPLVYPDPSRAPAPLGTWRVAGYTFEVRPALPETERGFPSSRDEREPRSRAWDGRATP